MKNLMAYLTAAKAQPEGFEQRQMEHNAFNPVHEARVEKAYQLKAPKLKMQGPQASQQPGSPWLNMGVKK